MSAFNKLKQVSSSSKKKNSSVKEIQDLALSPLVNRLVEASKALKNAEANWNKEQYEVLQYAKDLHKQTLQSLDTTKSYKINDLVMCTFTDKFSSFDEHSTVEVMTKLQEANISFEKLFMQKAFLKMRPEVASNESKLQELIDLLGDRVSEFFEVRVLTTPVENFDAALQREKAYNLISDSVERHRAKPSIRVFA